MTVVCCKSFQHQPKVNNMKPHHRIGAILTVLILMMATVRAEEVLWNITFDELAEGEALTGINYRENCVGPQRIQFDNVNTLLGAKSKGSFTTSPLVFTKGGNLKYTPSLQLILPNGKWVSAGVVTFSWEYSIEEMTLGPGKNMEVLINTYAVDGAGAALFNVTLIGVGQPGSHVMLASENLKDKDHPKAPKALKFGIGEIIAMRVVVDLNEHTVEIFVNDTLYGEKIQDPQRFASFRGLTMTDGAAVGGNYGGTFVAAIDNLKVTVK